MFLLLAAESHSFWSGAEHLGTVINNFWGYILLLSGLAWLLRYASKKVVRELDDHITDRLAGQQENLTNYLDEKLQPIEAELKHNGGSSVKDAVRRIEQNQAENSRLLNGHIDEDAKVQGLILDSLVRRDRVDPDEAERAQKG